MKLIIFIVFSISSVNSQNPYGHGGTQITLNGNVGYSSTANGGNTAVNSIIISGNSGDQRRPYNDVNTVRLNGQNGGGSNGPLNIVLSNNHGVAEDIRSGSFSSSFPNYNAYPQNNVNANRRQEYYPANPHRTAPSPLRPSFQYPEIKNSLNNGNDHLKDVRPGGGGLSIPYQFLWG